VELSRGSQWLIEPRVLFLASKRVCQLALRRVVQNKIIAGDGSVIFHADGGGGAGFDVKFMRLSQSLNIVFGVGKPPGFSQQIIFLFSFFYGEKKISVLQTSLFEARK